MKRLLSLVALLFLVVGTLLLSSCFTSAKHGTMRAGQSNPLVMIEAGLVRHVYGGFFVRYLIDRSTRTCWLVMGASVARMDCCALKRVPKANQFLTWTTCGKTSNAPAPPGGTIPPPANP